MTPEVVFTLQLAQYRVTIHYDDCHRYLGAQRRDLPYPRSVRFIACKFCRPSEEDIRAAVPDQALVIHWYDYGPIRGRLRVVPWFDGAENIAARRSLGWNKTPVRQTGWST